MTDNIEQRSSEWFEARKHRLTGSNIGAALGVNPWKSPLDLVRQMVRDYHGAESEFQGNIATVPGTLHERLALMDYAGKTDIYPEECGFFVHPEHEWLGASPDGLIGGYDGIEPGLIEVKCPFGLRNKKGADLVFKTAEEQPHYYAQMQIEMACAQRWYVDFYQWTTNGDTLERVDFNQKWWDESLPKLRDFYDWYLSEIDNPAHLEPKEKEINTLGAKDLLDEYDGLTMAINNAAARKKEIILELEKISKGRNALIHGRKFTQVERAGSISYAKALKELAPDADLTQWQGAPSKYWKLS